MTVSANNLPRANARGLSNNHRQLVVLLVILLTVTVLTLRNSLLAFNSSGYPYGTTTAKKEVVADLWMHVVLMDNATSTSTTTEVDVRPKTTVTTFNETAPTTGKAAQLPGIVNSKATHEIVEEQLTTVSPANLRTVPPHIIPTTRLTIRQHVNASLQMPAVPVPVLEDKNTNSTISSKSTQSAVPDDITTNSNISCSPHASGNFTPFAVPAALVNYSDFLAGFQNHTLGRNDAAICEFRSGFGNYWAHFPHAMQQLYACISFWNGHPSHPSVLAWSSKNHSRPLRSDKFVSGIITSLVNNNNVTFLNLDTTPAPNNTVSPKPHSDIFFGYNVQSPTQLQVFRDVFGYNVQSPTHLQVFRDATVQDLFPGRITSGCPANTTTLGEAASPRIGILNRDRTRRLQTVDILANELSQAFPMSSITIKEFESASFADQVDFYSSVDILISPHGAQLTGLPFMPKCGGVVELFPKGYFWPEFFGSLATGSGLGYGYVYMSGGNETDETKVMSATPKGRINARGVSFCPPSGSIVDSVRVLIQDWYQCCDRAAV
jgi:hypothetical protein